MPQDATLHTLVETEAALEQLVTESASRAHGGRANEFRIVSTRLSQALANVHNARVVYEAAMCGYTVTDPGV